MHIFASGAWRILEFICREAKRLLGTDHGLGQICIGRPLQISIMFDTLLEDIFLGTSYLRHKIFSNVTVCYAISPDPSISPGS